MVWLEVTNRLGSARVAELTGVAENDETVGSRRVPEDRWEALAQAIGAQGDPHFAETVSALGEPISPR